jgi:murein DD-endopeptidase MepM/ murein hydrolase activator NlpD
VDQGDIVLRGGRIGAVGETGRATGPHLHFEVRAGTRAIPPGPLLVFHDIRRLILRR